MGGVEAFAGCHFPLGFVEACVIGRSVRLFHVWSFLGAVGAAGGQVAVATSQRSCHAVCQGQSVGRCSVNRLAEDATRARAWRAVVVGETELFRLRRSGPWACRHGDAGLGWPDEPDRVRGR